RSLREAEALQLLSSDLPDGAVPRVFLVDSENFLFVMSAAPKETRNWKELLLKGTIDLKTAECVGIIHASLIGASWKSPDWEVRFGDVTVFDQLRLDPYYRATARVHPDLTAFFDTLIEDTLDRRVCLVHGDWSPKNFLVRGSVPMALDFEVAHYGNPAFDAAFLLNHLLLKSFHRREFLEAYLAAADRYWAGLTQRLPSDTGWFEQATVRHQAGLMLARVDGKSPVEYLNANTRSTVRAFAQDLIQHPPAKLSETFERARNANHNR
ncbi:MAG: phosphotransferase family protein, partial [Terriglobales bacterium]